MYPPLAISTKSSPIKHKNCSVVITWGSRFIFLCLLLVTISCTWNDIKRWCACIFTRAHDVMNSACSINELLNLGFVCGGKSVRHFVLMLIWKGHEWEVPGIREMNDTGSQDAQWMFVCLGLVLLTSYILHHTSTRNTCILHYYCLCPEKKCNNCITMCCFFFFFPLMLIW